MASVHQLKTEKTAELFFLYNTSKALLHGYVELHRTVLGMPNCVKRFRQVALT